MYIFHIEMILQNERCATFFLSTVTVKAYISKLRPGTTLATKFSIHFFKPNPPKESPMYSILRRKNEGTSQQAVAFARKLIHCPSPSFQEQMVADMVQKELQTLGYDTVLKDDAGNVAGILYGREKGPTVLLNSHMDTVDPATDDQWLHGPFSGAIDNGRLYGCGAADCKSGLATHVYAGALLKRSILPLRGNVIVAATVAEEHGTSAGVHHLLKHTLPDMALQVDYAVLGEPTDLGVYYGHDGRMELDIKVEGHNVGTIKEAVDVIIEEFKRHRLSDEKSKDHEELKIASPRFASSDDRTWATIGIDRRFRDIEGTETVLKETQHEAALASKTIKGISVDVAVRKETQMMYTGTTSIMHKITNAWSIDPFSPLMEKTRSALEAAGCAFKPGKWRLGRLGMGTAGGVLTRDYNVPVIGYGPGCEDVIHGPNEYVALENVKQAVYGTAAIVHRLVGTPVFGWTSDEP